MNGLTWTCHICKKERPDKKISVQTNEADLGKENVRYCNDNDDCREKAKTFSFFK